MAIRIQLRRDTAANWTSVNPVLLSGEIGVETDTLLFKIGNGSNWNDIPSYANTTPSGLEQSLGDYLPVSDRGVANGVASLDSNVKVPNTQIDSTYFTTKTYVDTEISDLSSTLSGDIAAVESTVDSHTTDIGSLNTTVTSHASTLSDLQSQKAAKSSPTFTGDVVLPSTTSIGEVSSTELSYVNGVTSGIQSQIDSKASSTSLSDHASDTTSIHGIADTSLLVTTTGTQTLSNKTLSSPTIEAGSITVLATETGVGTDYTSTYAHDGVADLTFYKEGATFSSFSVGDTVRVLSEIDPTINSVTWEVQSIDLVIAYLPNISLRATGVADGLFGTVSDGVLQKISGSSSTISATEISYLDGVTSNIQTQLSSKASSSDLSSHASDTTNIHGIADTSKLVTTDATSQTLDGSLTIEGDLVVHGTTTTINTSELSVADNLIYLNEPIEYTVTSVTGTGLAQVYTTAVNHDITTSMKVRITGVDPSGYNKSSYVDVDAVTSNTITVAGTEVGTYVSGGTIYAKADVNPDLGFSGGYNDGTYHHAGLFRDATDGTFKFFDSYQPEPAGSIDTSDVSFSLAPVSVDAITTNSVVFTDGTQTKEGVPSRTPIISKTESYTLSSLSERDSMIEVSSSSATTITIPANSAVAFPIGASIDVAQISTGQVTIAGAAGVTVNSTPGLKLRTQWSTVTLFKRGEDSWLVYGDLTA